MNDAPKTTPSKTTRDEEARDAQVRPGADRTSGPGAAVDGTPDEQVAEHFEEMMERGVEQRGEGGLP